jgi:hypothetical protein
MNGRQWYQARLRWAVMEEGRGLDHWREAEHLFQNDSREVAFEEALRIGRSQEYAITPDRPAGLSFEALRDRVAGREGVGCDGLRDSASAPAGDRSARI